MSIQAMERLLMEYAKIIDEQADTIAQQKKTIDILTRVLWNSVLEVTSAECPHDI